MAVILILIFASLGLALAFLAAFIWAVRAGQYEDTCTPSLRVLMEGEAKLGTSVQATSPQRRVNDSAQLKPLTSKTQNPAHDFSEPNGHL